MNGARSFRSCRSCHGKSRSHGCYLSSYGPFRPSLLIALRSMHYIVSVGAAYLVDEVCSLNGPTAWNVLLLNAHLLAKNVLANFTTRLAEIRTLCLLFYRELLFPSCTRTRLHRERSSRLRSCGFAGTLPLAPCSQECRSCPSSSQPSKSARCRSQSHAGSHAGQRPDSQV